MDLKTYISQLERGGPSRLAAALNVSPSYLSQLAAGSPISPARCVELEKATSGRVTRKDLRPNDYFDIWPEIDDRKKLRRRDDLVRAATE